VKARPLTVLTDDELAELLDKKAAVTHSYNSIVAEMDRRVAQRAAADNTRFARLALGLATVSLIVSAIGIVVQVVR
jgi:hypothetical protein